MVDFEGCFKQLPLIAILRGIRQEEVLEIVGSLVFAGFRLIEIPLNSPDPFTSIKVATDAFGDIAVIGAGTVLSREDALRTIDINGRLIVSPNVNPEVGKVCQDKDVVWAPGIITPSEAVSAISSGAKHLKVFPAEMVLPNGISAMRAVLPKDIQLIPVGGITPETMPNYVQAGADGFGLGSALYRQGDSAKQVSEKANMFVQTAHKLFG